MKKIKNRALTVLLLVVLAICGLGFYIVRYAADGSKWASAGFITTAFSRGGLKTGALTDREGVVLASVEDGRLKFADNEDVRRATLHAVGDLQGNIGTGALTVYAPELMGYNAITGAYSRTGHGETVALTLDSRLNVEAYKALGGRRGAVMVMDYMTGEVLCMVSTPAFDPAKPPDIKAGDPAFEGVYINRAISAAYPPGSTFKLLTAAAAIENIPGLFDRVFECTGGIEVGGEMVKCSATHGRLTFEQALSVSCNSVFGELALELGADTLAEYAKAYGLSEQANVGGIMTAKGNFDKAAPDSANLAWSGIGQYDDTVCPAAMLRYVAAIANGGVAAKMELLKKDSVPALMQAGSQRIMREDTARQLGDIMTYHGSQSFPGLNIHAKSGTAEVGGGMTPHAWFTGYITNEGHPLAFVVIVENGGGGAATAGPIANRVLQAAVKK